MMSIDEINLLQAQNEALKKQCNSLQQEVKQWKHEYEMLDACLELEQGKIAELKAYKDVNEDFKTAWEELKAENYELIETLKVYQRPDIVSVLTDYRTGELDRLREEVERLSKIETKLENYKRFYKETHAKLDELDCVKGYYKYKQTLQEIKTIAGENKDTVQYGGICRSILMIITKAEEE